MHTCRKLPLAGLALSFGLQCAIALLATPALSGQAVKQSSSGLCHCPGGSYYTRTKAVAVHDTIGACLRGGGREPKRGQGACPGRDAVPAQISQTGGARVSQGYDRAMFGGWNDDDGDCQNTRHELLAELSTGPVRYSPDGCRVVHGRWNDPYTGKIFTSSRNMDVDHIVPLKYAWDRGASAWSPDKRDRLANDPVNLFAVDAGANRSKGAKGPLEWLPPNERFACQYVTRFIRISIGYDLRFPAPERQRLDAQRRRLCS